eukprot:86362-Pelagomonas_calceolata.AAC.1
MEVAGPHLQLEVLGLGADSQRRSSLCRVLLQGHGGQQLGHGEEGGRQGLVAGGGWRGGALSL